MTDALILLGMCVAFVLVACIADKLAVKHRWIARKGARK